MEEALTSWYPPCANVIQQQGKGSSNCPKKPEKFCGHCHLVKYCSKECQLQHWPTHKLDCKGILSTEKWQPQWLVEKRKPAFIGGPSYENFGAKKYLWGNIPAFDVLKMDSNEGVLYDKDLNICFAASGDIRNLLQTVIDLPKDLRGTCSFTVNDRDLDVVARNILILLLAFSLPPDEASHVILHLWYSATLPKHLLEKIIGTVGPLISDVCTKIKDKKVTLQAKTWEFGSTKLRVVLAKDEWHRLLDRLNRSFKKEISETTRLAVVLAPSRIDYRHRRMVCWEPFHRISQMHSRRTGVLAAFGSDLSDFDTPNPTLFGPEGEWLQPDSASPLDGWQLSEVLSSGHEAGYPKNDLFGSLGSHILIILKSFCTRAQNGNLSVHIYQLDARQLPEFSDAGTFDRIEVANLTDRGWLGVHTILETFAPLLRNRTDNPYATLIAYFLNAVPEIEASRYPDIQAMKMVTAKVAQFIPPSPGISQTSMAFVQHFSARNLFLDFDGHFKQAEEEFDFRGAAKLSGTRMKNENTIVRKWPHRLQETPGTEAAKREFDLLHMSGLTGCERYVEWIRSF